MIQQSKTIVLIHGLWMTPSSLDLFRDFYEQRGYRVLVPAWPRLEGNVHAMRRDPLPLAGLGVVEIADHYSAIVRSMDERPILIGHSFGGLIVQMLLDRGMGSAGVAIDATTPKGIWAPPFSVIKSAKPVLRNPLNYWRTVMLSFEQFKYAFANTMTDAQARSVYDEQVIPGPGRPIFQAVFANFIPRAATIVNRLNYKRAPLLLISATHDNLVPSMLNERNYELYQHSTATTDYAAFADRSHLIVAQDGWQEVAEYAIGWVERKTGLLRKTFGSNDQMRAPSESYPRTQAANSAIQNV